MTAKDALEERSKQPICVRISKGQKKVLDECVRLTGQTQTDLIKESITSYLYPLYKRLKGMEEATHEPKVD